VPHSLSRKWATKGFDGPFYAGVRGKIRFFVESTIGRSEIIFTATPASFGAVAPPTGPPIELVRATSFAELERFKTAFDAEYYPGYVEAWRAPFTWGEQAVVALVDGRPAGFAWLQFGNARGFPTYYGRIFEHEARVLRVGVAPSFRRQGVNTAMMYGVLASLFASGVKRACIECHKYNTPSVRTFLRVGYRPAAMITVLELPGMRRFVRWRSVESAAGEFTRLGIELMPTVSSSLP
jgi:GNAT superfamily N-acetyltransferase